MKFGWSSMAAALLLSFLAPAQDAPASREESRPALTPAAEKLASIEAEYEAAMKAFSAAYKEAKTEEEKEKVFEEKYPKAGAWYPKLLELAKSGVEEPVVVSSLVWVISHGAQSAEGKEALAILARDHVKSAEIKRAFSPLSRMMSRTGEDFMRNAMTSNPNDEVKAQAAYSLSQALRFRAEAATHAAKADGELKKALEKRYGEEDRALLAATDPAAIGKEVEQLLDRVKEMTAGAKWGTRLAESAAGDLFEIRNLAIGMPAPEITGEDLDGKPMKLSDYKGRVVVLDFWGHW